MAKVRINFGISEEIQAWIKTQPAIDGMDVGSNYVVVEHHMTGPEASALKSAFIDKLIEPI